MKFTNSLKTNSFKINSLKALAGWYLALLVLAIPATADNSPDDLPGLSRYPNARIELKESRDARNYPLISSRLKKVNNEVRAESSDWRDGLLERRVYQLPSGHSSESAYQHMIARLEEMGVKALFKCSSRDCGKSNLWANETFGVATLNGYDRDQFYWLGSRMADKGEEFYVLYTIKRGNRRVYLLIDRLQVSL